MSEQEASEQRVTLEKDDRLKPGQAGRARRIEELEGDRVDLEAEIERLTDLLKLRDLVFEGEHASHKEETERRARAEAEVARLTARCEALEAELESQWEENHFEHCGRLPHREGEACMWPRPAVLVVAPGEARS